MAEGRHRIERLNDEAGPLLRARVARLWYTVPEQYTNSFKQIYNNGSEIDVGWVQQVCGEGK